MNFNEIPDLFLVNRFIYLFSYKYNILSLNSNPKPPATVAEPSKYQARVVHENV